MDNRFVQCLVGGLFALIVAAFIIGNNKGDIDNGTVITAGTTLIGIIIGGALAAASREKPPR